MNYDCNICHERVVLPHEHPGRRTYEAGPDSYVTEVSWATAYVEDPTLCGHPVTIDGAPFSCNLEKDHIEQGRHRAQGKHQAQGDVPVRFTLTWRELP